MRYQDDAPDIFDTQVRKLNTGERKVPIFLFGDRVATVSAGATRNLPDGCKLIRCAAEIKVDHERVAFDVSTEDFSPFDDDLLIATLPDIVTALSSREPLYIGCMGGTGRTGTLLAILAAQHPEVDGAMAINYIRSVYRSHAVETSEQMDQVHRFARLKPAYVVWKDTQDALFSQPSMPEKPARTLLQRLFGWG